MRRTVHLTMRHAGEVCAAFWTTKSVSMLIRDNLVGLWVSNGFGGALALRATVRDGVDHRALQRRGEPVAAYTFVEIGRGSHSNSIFGATKCDLAVCSRVFARKRRVRFRTALGFRHATLLEAVQLGSVRIVRSGWALLQ